MDKEIMLHPARPVLPAPTGILMQFSHPIHLGEQAVKITQTQPSVLNKYP